MFNQFMNTRIVSLYQLSARHYWSCAYVNREYYDAGHFTRLAKFAAQDYATAREEIGVTDADQYYS